MEKERELGLLEPPVTIQLQIPVDIFSHVFNCSEETRIITKSMKSTLVQDENYIQSTSDFSFLPGMDFPGGNYSTPFIWPLFFCLWIDCLLAPSSNNMTEGKIYKMYIPSTLTSKSWPFLKLKMWYGEAVFSLCQNNYWRCETFRQSLGCLFYLACYN